MSHSKPSTILKFVHGALFSTAALLVSGCSTVSDASSMLKAKPASLSSFLEHRSEMRPQRERAPFALVWVNPVLRENRASYSSIYVAPVITSYLRPAKKTLTEKTGVQIGPRPVREIASYMRRSFEDAFRYSAYHQVRQVHAPIPGGVTLQLALVELNPTDAHGNVVKSAVPYAGVLGSFTTGNIAIEGQVTDNVTHEVLFEFADNEKDKMSVVSMRDFAPYEHAKVAIREWAQQLDELAHTSSSHKVEDSASFTLSPF